MEIASTTNNAGGFHVIKTLLEDDEEPHYIVNIACRLIVLEKNINIFESYQIGADDKYY